MEGASVSEIHHYPPRPEGFEEPLFPTVASRQAVAEHLLRAPWLSRASELVGRGGQAVHARREVRAWWDEEQATDRVVFRVLLCDGAVVDLAREHSREWFLVGVAD